MEGENETEKEERAYFQALKASLKQLSLRNQMTIEELLNPVEEDATDQPELNDQKILKTVQEEEEEETKNLWQRRGNYKSIHLVREEEYKNAPFTHENKKCPT